MPKGIYIQEAGQAVGGGSSGTYDTSLASGLTMPNEVGGYPAGTAVADVSGDTFIQMFDNLLFPTVLASIGTNVSATLAGVSTTTAEVGTAYAPVSTGTLNPGVINNGDGSTGPNLKGDANEFRFYLPDTTLDHTVSSPVDNDEDWTFTSYDITFGTNRWQVQIDYDAGTGTYYDNKGNAVTNLDASRGAGTASDYSSTITGRRYAWWGSGTQSSAPTNSAGVRGLSDKQFLDGSNEGTFTITIPASTQEVYFFVPAGKNVSVAYVESSYADVTISFTETQFNVDDAGGNPISYDSWVSYIGASGYPSEANYEVTIS
jgi:hypothetical protein